ncbi:MAG: hypothetical protein K0U84_22190 [Actinomycetia bacterium]|nr:hypothetical protein [Actinomycetes bacterium]
MATDRRCSQPAATRELLDGQRGLRLMLAELHQDDLMRTHVEDALGGCPDCHRGVVDILVEIFASALVDVVGREEAINMLVTQLRELSLSDSE